MTTTRRGFLGALLAAAAAPAFARAGSLMQITAPRTLTLWGDGLHDDTKALQMIFSGGAVMHAGSRLSPNEGRIILPQGIFKISDTLVWDAKSPEMLVSDSEFFTSPEITNGDYMMRWDDGCKGLVTNCQFRDERYRLCA